jgi:glycosyltransferase involved in cell wall biosynthesis
VTATLCRTGGNLPRRIALASKSVSFYLGDERGYRESDCVVACTDLLARQLRSQGIRAVACPPPVRLLAPQAEGPRRRHDPSRVELLVCGGNLALPRKNLRHAVEALRFLARPGREVTLSAIGHNPEGLLDAARGLPQSARVVALGPMRAHEVHAKMREVDAFLFPSLFEEWGYAAVEALVSGTPVVAYPVYPFRDMLSGGLGVVATQARPRSLADAVERVLAGECAEDLAEQAAGRFGIDAVGRRLARLWSGDEPGADGGSAREAG